MSAETAPRQTGTPEERITTALQDALSGLTMADLMHVTAMSWDEVYPVVQRLLGRRVVEAVHGKEKMSQGEKVSGATRYRLRRYGRGSWEG